MAWSFRWGGPTTQVQPGLFQFNIVGDPPPEAWNRVQRYASWMRRVYLVGWFLGGDTITKLRQNSPPGGWFPAMRNLSWNLGGSANIPYADLFFSPHLEVIHIFVTWNGSEIPRDVLPSVATAISALPTSSLKRIRTEITHPAAQTYLTDSLSSVVLRCGPSLTEFRAPMPLTDAAITHLAQLPNLLSWHIRCLPPTYSTSSLPLVFPPLTKLVLEDGAPRGWFSLFKHLDRDVSSTRPLSRVKKSLESLVVIYPSNTIIDVSSTSAIQVFCNLVDINVMDSCYDTNGRNRCVFRLKNDDVAEFAAALPRLEILHLGSPCSGNTCVTTIACLLLISIHCVKLRELSIHFNTTNIIDDLQNISVDPRFQALRSLPRCTLSCLDVYQMPLNLNAAGFETVANGMVDIFPSLEWCRALEGNLGWEELTDRIEV